MFYRFHVSLNHNSQLTRFCFCSVTQQIVDVGTNISPASTPVFYPLPLRQTPVTVQFSPLSTLRLHSPPYVPISPLHTPYTWTLEPSFQSIPGGRTYIVYILYYHLYLKVMTSSINKLTNITHGLFFMVRKHSKE